MTCYAVSIMAQNLLLKASELFFHTVRGSLTSHKTLKLIFTSGDIEKKLKMPLIKQKIIYHVSGPDMNDSIYRMF